MRAVTSRRSGAALAWLAALLGLLAVAGPVREVAGAARIDALRVLRAPDAGAGTYLFPPGTRRVWVTFRYEEAAGERVGLSVTGRGGIGVFASEDRYNGSGTASIEVSGAAIYRGLAAQLEAALRQAQEGAQEAATQSAGVHEHLLSAQAGLLQAGSAMGLLGGADLSDDDGRRLSGARAAAAEAGTLARQAIALPLSDTAGKRVLAGQMGRPLATAVTAASGLSASAAGAGETTIPSTGIDERSAYTVQVSVGASPAASAEFVVYRGDRVYLPRTER